MIKRIGYLHCFLILLFLVTSCNLFEDDEECNKTDAPEINFGLLVGGQVKIINSSSGEDITSDFDDKEVLVFFNKVYCNGKTNGPFEDYFVLDNLGVMWRNAVGTWEFRMDNTEDYMRIVFFIEGDEIGKYNIDYNMLKADDNGKAYFEFDILCEYFESTSGNYLNGTTITLR